MWPRVTVPLADPVWLGATLALALCLMTIAVVDWRSFRIPDAASLPLLAAGLALAWAVPGLAGRETDFADHLIGAAGAYLFFAALGEVIFRRTGQEALGLGDAKLFGAAGAWLGWQALPVVLLIASLTGLAFAVIQRQRAGTRRIAFGPWIALGLMGTWLLPALG